FKLTVVKVAEDATTEEETTEPETPATEPEEVIDYEALAEAQKDAEGVEAFTQLIDIDPDAVNQEIYMVAKQSFTDDALKGFDYKDQEKAAKKAAKKLVTISKKGKISAKKPGTVVFQKTDNGVVKTLSVNVVKPVMPTKKAKLNVDGGKQITVKIDGLDATPSVNVVFISSDPTKASVSYDSAKREAYVTGIVKGKVNVVAYVNGKTYKTPVKINSNAVESFVGYINKGVKNKAIKATGVKKWEIISANDAVLTLNAKGTKFTAGVAGAVSVNGLNKKGEKVVTGWIYVQDLDLTAPESISVNGVSVNAGKKLTNETKESKRGANKKETYSIEIKLDQKEGENGGIKKGYAKLAFADYKQDQPVIFKSSKAANVYYNGNGLIVAKKAYKKPIKLTGKINGKTIVIKVTVKEAE
nr:IPT/TIG domain-containing protein [Lachnospiraceae bacterium]